MRRVKDKKYPNMYRIKYPDGRLSDMANLTRINEAIDVLKEKHSRPILKCP